MFTKVSIANQDRVVALADTPGLNLNKVVKILAAGQAYELDSDSGLDQADYIDLANVAQGMQALIKQVSANFVQRDEMILALAVMMIAGEHGFFIGSPGTAKTSIIRQFTGGIQGSFWSIMMNQDTTRESLIGMIDPVKLQAGEWTRRWAGAATHHVVYTDEAFKASAQVLNIMLDLMEERTVSEGDIRHQAPLLSLIGSSNEMPEGEEFAASLDRFLVRLTVSEIRDIAAFEAMILASGNTVSVQANGVTVEHLRLTAAAAELMALTPPDDLLSTVKNLFAEIGVNGRGVSSRRWRKTIKLACAHSILFDRQPCAMDMRVGQWTLWQDQDEEPNIRKLVLAKTDPYASELLSIERMYADLEAAIKTIGGTDYQAKTELSSKGGRLVKRIKGLAEKPGIGEYLPKLNQILDSLMNPETGLMTRIIRAGIDID